jgi:hypothetical protein
MSGTQKKVKEIQGKQELLLVSLNKFYQDDKNRLGLTNILEGKDRISLRIIDWFVTNYSKKSNVQYIIKTKITSPKRTTMKKNMNYKSSKKDLSKYTSSNKVLNVYLSYKAQLRAYSKKQFDPFCRRNRIDFYFNDTDFITTTVGQLNFFRWALQNNVIEYIMENYEVIEDDMNENTKKQRMEKKKLVNSEVELAVQQNITLNKKKIRKKRKPLSVAATSNMNKNNNPVLVSFD